jgi:asparaginyl-tRNA synthetase
MRLLMFSEKKKQILRTRAKLVEEARNWLNRNGYVEVHGPTLIPDVACSPENFEVNYFGKKTCLSQGLQPYANFFISGFDKVYTIAPTFRAETRRTSRHLSEFWRIEATQRSNLDAMLMKEEQLVTHICGKLAETARLGPQLMQSALERLAAVKAPFPQNYIRRSNQLAESRRV